MGASTSFPGSSVLFCFPGTGIREKSQIVRVKAVGNYIVHRSYFRCLYLAKQENGFQGKVSVFCLGTPMDFP